MARDGMFRLEEARVADAPRLHALVERYAAQNVMLPRTVESIVQTLPDWVVAVAEAPAPAVRQVIGGACLTVLAPELSEVRSLVVDPERQGEGIGRCLVERIIDMARARGYQQLCALTLVPKFFLSMGFRPVEVADISPKVWVDCQHCPKYECCDEYALVMDLVPNPVLPNYRRTDLPLPMKSPNWVPLDLVS
ncbi:MAG: GNAT family N-acetyltransferase [Caldilineaceae bacterium SB0662_bin_9]|uniref:GNAT family N-acetyltransferase n=1 Tax=Caldilineaceae bacterium SB0662_bin_9 TaxID=2605258 RepID=A0A6B1DZ30_9CHLR|nr:GNAT family N-acetyltransferase [Caldilineaceae bacterium]MYD91604.1 GNAT family N-acetyltransferase [Caldilineaceae bacterium SB0662_bin_9]